MHVYVPLEAAFMESVCSYTGKVTENEPLWTTMAKFQRRVFLGCVFLIFLFCFRAYYFEMMISLLRPACDDPVPSTSPFLIDRLDLDCAGILSNEGNRTAGFYRRWVYDSNYAEQQIIRSADRCSAMKSRFHFRSTPLSLEEAEYPLAYGLIVYKNVAQTLFMLSSFYHPQNVYCIAVDDEAAPRFHIIMRELGECLPNVHVVRAKQIRWGSYEVLSSLYTCFNYTTRLNHPWKYYQYLAGVDVPLKTNLEMVRIFKAMNESMNFEIFKYQDERLQKRKKSADSPLNLFKSSMSALVPRSAADKIVKSEKVEALLKFLEGTKIPDESFWATIGGNPDSLPLGQLDAAKLLASRDNSTELSSTIRKRDLTLIDEVLATENDTVFSPDYCGFSSPCRNYISRFQVWGGPPHCRGKSSAGSCVFGILDLPTLLNRPELVAHKLYIDYEPAAFFCALKSVNHRALHSIPFNASEYSRLPSVELKSGKPIEQLTYPEKMFGNLFPN